MTTSKLALMRTLFERMARPTSLQMLILALILLT